MRFWRIVQRRRADPLTSLIDVSVLLTAYHVWRMVR